MQKECVAFVIGLFVLAVIFALKKILKSLYIYICMKDGKE